MPRQYVVLGYWKRRYAIGEHEPTVMVPIPKVGRIRGEPRKAKRS